MGDTPRILTLMAQTGKIFRQSTKRVIAFTMTLALLLSHSAGVIAQAIPDIDPPRVDLEIVDSAPAKPVTMKAWAM